MQTFGTFALSCLVIDIKQDTFQLAVAVCQIKPRGQLGFKFLYDNVGLYP